MTNTDQQAPTTTEETSPGPFDGLKDAAWGLGKTVLDAGFHRAGGLTDKLTSRLTEFAEGKKEQAEEAEAPGPVANAVKEAVVAKVEGENPATAAIKGALGGVKNKLTGGGGGKGGKGGQKFSNIVEWIDVGVPLRVAYNQWTEFEQWTSFMKKVETVERNEEEGKVAFKARVFLSHRSWESTIVEMVPDDHIVWQSTGQKGYLNGGVTFHELAPTLTRMCVVVEYHPQGLVEKTLNIWRSVGRAVRRELKRYVHQVMTHTILDPDSVEGWRAEIRDKEIVRSHDEVVEQEQREAEASEQEPEEEAPQAAGDESDEDETADDQAEPGTSDEDADAAEDATYLDEAGVGQEEEPAEEDEESDEGEPEDRGSEESEDAYDEPEDEDSGDEGDEGEPEDEYEPGDEGEPEDSESEDEDESGDSESGDSEDEDSEDEDADGEYESEDDESAEDEYEDEESEGDDDEYEDEDEGSEDEYEPEDEDSEDEGAEESGPAPSSGTEDEGAGDGSGSTSTPTPKDVASGPVQPAESPRPRRRQRA